MSFGLLLSEIAASGNFVRIVELFPPALPMPGTENNGEGAGKARTRFDLALRFEKLVENVQRLESLADGFSLPELKDHQRIHLNTVGIASELHRRTGNEIIPTITLRDSNRVNLLGTITFAIFAGIENIMLVRGDPFTKPGDNRSANGYPKNVYDYGRVSEVVSLIRRVESTLANDLKTCIISPIRISGGSKDPQYIDVIKAREFAGVDMFLAESFFEDVNDYLEKVSLFRKSGITRPIIHSIFPFKSYDDALWCTQKFGWQVADPELLNLKSLGTDYGIDMARKRYEGLLDRKSEAQGVCISSRGNYDFVQRIAGATD